MRTTPITLSFWHIHVPKLKTCYIVAAGIGLLVNAHKSEYFCFNKRGDISTLNGSSLKLVDKFSYLESSDSSTKTDINTQLAKAWTATIGYRSYGSQT